MKRCCNIDWLEVFCYEPSGEPRDELYFLNAGYQVKSRGYGTPQYKSMFTVYQQGNVPLLEIRRSPRSLKREGGIFENGACSIRLVNRSCYLPAPVSFLRQFLLAHEFTFRSITRIDICLDFNTLDGGKDVTTFIESYMKGKISKLNQCNLAAHGADRWAGRSWNSLKWGSPTSNVTTKIYNKSMEMRQVGPKFYIMDCWQDAGLDMSKDVWRVEFSITSQAQTIVNIKSGEIVKKSLSDYDTPERLLFQWAVLAGHYFHFKKVVKGPRGGLVRKDRCPDVLTFKVTDIEAESYKPTRNPTVDEKPTRTLKILLSVLERIAENEDERNATRYAAVELYATLAERCRIIEASRKAELLRSKIGFMEKPKRDYDRKFASANWYEIELERILIDRTKDNEMCPF